jgi:hypothetical protein
MMEHSDLNLVCCHLMQGEGTVKPFAAFNAEEDSKALRRAMKGIGMHMHCNGCTNV